MSGGATSRLPERPEIRDDRRPMFLRSLLPFVLVASPMVTACAPERAPEAPASNTTGSSSALVQGVGRVERSSELGLRYAWSGAGFRLAFSGSSLTLKLRDQNHHTVLLDGQPQPVLVTTREREEYVVAQGLDVRPHQLEVRRRTEASFGPTELLGVTVGGGQLLPVAAGPSRRIEVLGDSISCGYGNEGKDTSCPFSAATENHDRAYGAVLGRLLEAEVSTVAWSGRGVMKNYGGGAGELMPVLFERTLPEEPESRWSFAEHPVDAVVINLGTNDFSTEPDPDPAEFGARYLEFLERIRRAYPEALILCTVGPMLSGTDLEKAEGAIQTAVAARAEGGDRRVHFHAMKTENRAPGCDWHPSVATHEAMGRELAAVLSPLLARAPQP